MPTTLKADTHNRMAVSGDLVASLKMPLTGIEDRFWIALSDGSRILATPDMTGAYAFQLVDEGAAIVHIDGNRIDVEWSVDWIALSAFYDAVRRPADEMARCPSSIGLLLGRGGTRPASISRAPCRHSIRLQPKRTLRNPGNAMRV